MADRVTCPCCGCDAPPGEFCIRCGSLLERRFRRYGANPKERAGLPYLVSTLFPGLPRAEMRAFRLVLAAGAALTVLLAVLGLFPLALTSAALLVPVLTVLYLWDVDVYEDQPWRVIGLTLGIGAVAGVALGIASEELLPDDDVTGGVIVPLLALALALSGPVVLLLPRERFNDILDGATFGAVSAAALTAAMALTRGASLLAGGLSPDGDTSEWVVRLAGLGIGMPVLAMCAAGGAAAALWARWRAPLADRRALGPLAHPVVAVPVAAVLMVAAAVTQQLLPGAVWLAEIVALDALGLLWLRHVVHEGMRQQAEEREEGPPTPCRECGRTSILHSYCAHCGTSRMAVPKGDTAHRRSPLVLVPAAVIAAGLGAATAGAAIADPGDPAPPCVRVVCGAPPEPPADLVRETEVPGRGWTGVYDPEVFTLEDATRDGYDLQGRDLVPVTVRVRVQGGDDAAGALAAERERLDDEVLGLVDDRDPEHRVAGAMIGYEPAESLVVAGTADSPQGPGDGFTAAILAATDGGSTAVVTISSFGKNDDRRRAVLGAADVVLQGFRWPGSDDTASATLVLEPRRAARFAGRPLRAAEIGRRFGPTRGALGEVRRAVRALGLQPGAVPPQRTVMRVRGPRPAIARVFADGVPPSLRGRVRSVVTDLDRRPVALPAAFPAGGLRPVDARRVYGMEGVGLGDGETIAVLSLDTFRDEDIAEYDRIVGVDSGPVERVPVNGGIARVGPDTEEVNLDLDVIRGLVPRARLLNFEAPNRAGAFGDVVDAVVADGRAKIISISWGRCDLTLPADERDRDEAAFAAAAAAGVTILVASGDSGAYECERFDPADQRLSVSWPAASRHVIAVGGTTLRVADDRSRESEAGWESPLSNAGAGGGVASAEPQPEWQRDPAVPGLDNEHSTGTRQVPDVAAAADFRTGWTAVVDGERRAYGGTSAAAPFWAAVIAVLRAHLRAEDRPLPASMARLLYAVAARPGNGAFHDVTTGGNRFHDAGPGWDYVTGLGTPDVAQLLAAAARL